MRTIVVSFSGGRTSAYMAWRMKSAEEFKDCRLVFVFANTGKEREETLRFVHECDTRWGLGVVWVEAEIVPEMGVGCNVRVVNFDTASRKGEPFNAMVQKFGIPNSNGPICTKELKSRPISKWCKQNLPKGYEMAIGYRIDEMKRVNRKTAARNRWIFPLVDMWPTFKVQVRNFWDSQPFDLGLKDYQGNCDLCWKKSLRNRLTIIKENPDVADQWLSWEAGSDLIFDRDQIPLPDLVSLAKSGKFKPMIDRHEFQKMIGDGILGASFCSAPDLDRSAPCHCSFE